MSFEAYLTADFEYPHENDMFATLAKELEKKFEATLDPHILIGNLLIEGSSIDAIFLKPKCIAVVEMKSHAGRLRFYENVPWQIESNGAICEVKGGTKTNPYQQVRAYRLSLKNFLRNRQSEILRRIRPILWDHVSAAVLFRGPVVFNDTIVGGLRMWFAITDMSRVANYLADINNETLQLEPDEILAIPAILGLNSSYLYTSVKRLSTTPLEICPVPPSRPAQFIYLKEFPIRDQEEKMRNLGGARSQGSQRLRELLEQVRQGLNPFASFPYLEDSRIKGARIYRMNSVAEIVLIHKEADAILAFFGEPKDVQGWIAAHEGLVIPVDYTSGRYSSTRVSEPDSNEKLQPPALTTETRPLLAQLDELNLEDIVPPRKIREALLNLDKESLDHEIKDTIDMVADEDVRLFLFDIINLIRSGDHTGAAVRLKLRTGAAVPLNDSGEFGRQAAGFGANSDQAKVLNNLSEEELNRLLDPKKFQDWMLFLHPDQQSLAEAQFDRPVILTGISGSGKTCVLVHRARYLARKYPGQKIGILTLSGTLAGLLQNLVNRLLTEEERKNVTVKAFYDVFRDCLNYLGPDKYFAQLAQQVDSSSHLITALRQAKEKWPNRMVWNCDPISKVRVEDEWDEFYMSRYPGLREWIGGIVRYLEENRADASRYLQEEFTLIRSQFAVPNRSNYLDTEDRRIRAGRAIQFRREIRQDSLRALLFWEEWLLAGGMIDDLGLTQALMPLHTEMQQLPSRFRFRCLLVDEFQDFSTLDLQLFRRIVPLDEPDALFLTGDTVQKILVKRQSLQQAGLERGSAIHKSILKNYRNSKQVLRAASRLANHYGAMAKSQDEELEVLDPELAQRETNPPIVLKTDNQIAKAWELAIECTRDNKTEPWTVCIATANPHKVTIDAILEQRPKELAARQLSGDCILHPEEVVVGSISAMKGFEFRLALIIGCDAGIFPEEGVPHEEIWRDALRLYVAMTRGRDQVYLLHEGNPSEFIAVLGDTVITREEPLLTPYEQAETKPKPKPYSTAVLPAQIKKLHRLNMDEHCENWFSQIELEALNKYFARCVYRDGLTFKEWLKPKGLMMVRPKLFYGLHRCPPTVISGILTKLKEKGINP